MLGIMFTGELMEKVPVSILRHLYGFAIELDACD